MSTECALEWHIKVEEAVRLRLCANIARRIVDAAYPLCLEDRVFTYERFATTTVRGLANSSSSTLARGGT